MADDKINKAITNYVTHEQKHVLQNKKNFSSWKTIYHKFVKKDNIDPAFDYTKEIIKRMERDKMSSQTAMQVAETLMPEMQNVRKRIILMAIPMALGAILLMLLS